MALSSPTSQWIGLPNPSGTARTKFFSSAKAERPLIWEWMLAPSSRPWKSMTSGVGVAFASVAGALTSHQRALSPTVRSTLVNSAAVVALLQPGDGRAAISAAAVGASVVEDSVVEDSVVDVSPPDSLAVVVAVDEFVAVSSLLLQPPISAAKATIQRLV